MNASRSLRTALLLGLVSGIVGIILILVSLFLIRTGMPGPSNEAGATETQARQEQTSGQQTDSPAEVDREQAAGIAVEHLGGEGEATWISRESAYGALWEVEVTTPNGRETDVYVAADGSVTHVSGGSQGRSQGGSQADGSGDAQNDGQDNNRDAASEPADPGQTINARQAGEIAAAHVGGTVDTVHRERGGDHGAAWDVDVYSDEGEYIIYVSATGEVVHVEGPFDW